MREPTRPADLLDGILREAKAAAATQRTSVLLANVLGPSVAPHCRVVSERGGRLLVDVDSAPLFAELQSFRREDVRRTLNEKMKDRKFATVSFRLHSNGNV